MKIYSGHELDRISFALGGIGAGTICFKGNGSLGDVGIRNRPGIGNDPRVFAALTIKGEKNVSKVLEGPIPDMNVTAHYKNSGGGYGEHLFGLPRFTNCEFTSKFPFASVRLSDEIMPVTAEVKAWSPFVPSKEDDSSLPFAGIEYTFTNTEDKALESVFYFSSSNFIARDGNALVRRAENGFILEQPVNPEDSTFQGAFAAEADQKAYVNMALPRGGWFDTKTLMWVEMQNAYYADKEFNDNYSGKSDGAYLAVPFSMEAHGTFKVKIRLSWYVPGSGVANYKGTVPEPKIANLSDYYQPWYSGQFAGIDDVAKNWKENYDRLYDLSNKFANCFFDTDIPAEITEAISSNLCILRSNTVMRGIDGRFYAFEGCGDDFGWCNGTTTHVWTYQQTLSHLFPALERTMREVEYVFSQNEEGHQDFRCALPVAKTPHNFHAAADGQLGGIVKVFREWHISGDNEWLRKYWPLVRSSLDYCIRTWDPEHKGAVIKTHHNTYDIEFWGADGMCTGYYTSALKAACLMGKALGDDVSLYEELYGKSREYLEKILFNGEYLQQNVEYGSVDDILHAQSYAGSNYSPELSELIAKEGPRYQYGTGCLSDAVVGIWLGEMCGLTDIISEDVIVKTLLSIFKYNFRFDLSAHSNPQRPGYALGKDGGLLLCSWPHGGKPSLPFVYSDEVWTGIEYQVASHLISKGYVQEGLTIVRTLRKRYDGTKRNPFCEYECGYWYARALSCYALIQAYTGVRYDAVEKTLHVSKKNQDSFKAYLSTENGFGTVSVKGDKVEYIPALGNLEICKVVFD